MIELYLVNKKEYILSCIWNAMDTIEGDEGQLLRISVAT